MTKPNFDASRIKFRIEGIIALCVSKNKKEFDVGVVKSTTGNGYIPGHDISMVIIKQGTSTPIVSYNITIPKQLSLQINSQPSSMGIEFFMPGNFNRKQRRDDYNFKWAIDVGNGELQSGPVNIYSAALRSVLHVKGIESAIFYTDNLSTKELRIEDRQGNRKIGFIAGAVEALIPLPQAGANFTAESQSYELRYEPKVKYDITIKQVCSTEKACSSANIKSIYNNLFSTGVHDGEIDIIGIEYQKEGTSTPEIGCVGVNFSANPRLPQAT